MRCLAVPLALIIYRCQFMYPNTQEMHHSLEFSCQFLNTYWYEHYVYKGTPYYQTDVKSSHDRFYISCWFTIPGSCRKVRCRVRYLVNSEQSLWTWADKFETIFFAVSKLCVAEDNVLRAASDILDKRRKRFVITILINRVLIRNVCLEKLNVQRLPKIP